MGLRRLLQRTGYSLLYRRQGIYRSRRQVPKNLREIVLANPTALAFHAVQQDVAERRQRPRTEDELDAESLALADALEKVTDREPDPVRAKILRAVLTERQR